MARGSSLVVRRVAVVAKLGTKDGLQIARELSDWLAARSITVRCDAHTAAALGLDKGFDRDSLPQRTDLIIVAGGDGTLLSAARAAAPRGIPILGINLGSLGFLTELQPDEWMTGLERLFQGRYEIEERHMLKVRYRSGGKTLQEHTVLNDVVITKSALARMVEIDASVDGEAVATYTSDGLIISTPTGSTAYNLSAGGPILDPRMKAIVLAPICPHTMTYRPLVFPETVRIELTLRPTEEEVYLTLDGQVGFPIKGGDRIHARLARSPVQLVRVAGLSFFEVLQRKLRWGTR